MTYQTASSASPSGGVNTVGAAQDVINLAGSGSEQTIGYFLQAGNRSFTLSYMGNGDFVVRLLGGSGNVAGEVIKISGPYNGTVTYTVSAAATYSLDVSANGPWTMTVR